MTLDWHALRRASLEPAGFGSQRTRLWPALLNARPHPASSDQQQPHPDEHQIQLDTERSFVLYPHNASRTHLQADLHALLLSFFRKHPKLSYFQARASLSLLALGHSITPSQGYHDIVTVLFLTLPQELQLVCVEKLSLHRLRDSMGAGLEPVLGLLRVTQNLIRLADPAMASMLEQSSSLPFFALPNLLTLFSHDMPTLPLIQHVFDFLLCRPPIAVIYLAAALILSRKDQVKRLQDEDEDGMIHSLLSSLPPLTDDPEPQPQPITTTTNDDHDADDGPRNGNNKDLDSLRETQASPTFIASDHIDTTDNGNNDNDTTLIPPPSPSPGQDPDVDIDSTNPFSPPPESDLTLVDTTDPSEEDGNNNSNSNDTCITTTMISTPTTQQPKTVTGTTESEETQDEYKIIQQQQPPITLSSLLTQADALYTLYPPSHPSLLLSSIMGPQSVVYTWSENFKDWPEDTMAEAMVARPELVVYPYVEPSPPPSSDEEDEEEDEKHTSTKTKPRRNKLKKRYRPGKHRRGDKRMMFMRPPKMERRTVVASAVLVLGVAMAVYGAKNNSSNTSSAGKGFGLGLGLDGFKSARHWPWKS